MSVSKEIIGYRVARSEAAVRMALIAGDEQDWNHVCNRLYYSVFYIVSAYMASIKSDAKTHNGIRIKFHQLFMKTGLLGEKSGELYDLLFNIRQDADYSDLVIYKQDEVHPLMEQTKELMEQIKSFIKI